MSLHTMSDAVDFGWLHFGCIELIRGDVQLASRLGGQIQISAVSGISDCDADIQCTELVLISTSSPFT